MALAPLQVFKVLLVLLFLFLTPNLWWGGAGEGTGSGTGGLAKVMKLMVEPGEGAAVGGLGDDLLACSTVDWLAQLSCEAWPSLPLVSVESGGAAVFFFFFFCEREAGCLPPPSPGGACGSGCADRPPGLLTRVAGSSGGPAVHRSAGGKRERQRSPALTNPPGPSHPQSILRLDGKTESSHGGGELGEAGWAQEVVEGDWVRGWGGGLLQGSCISLASLLISMTSVTHWPKVFNISWPLEPAPCPSPQAPFVCLLPPRGIPVTELLNY